VEADETLHMMVTHAVERGRLAQGNSRALIADHQALHKAASSTIARIQRAREARARDGDAPHGRRDLTV
jgi:hypothetical protein